MKAIRYRITLEEPVLVTSVEGDPNSAVSFDFLPGSALRGVLIGRYLGDKARDLPGNEEARRLFFDGTTRYLNGYLVGNQQDPEVGSRCLPMPLSWHQPKGERDHDILDFASIHPQPGWVNPRGSFWTPDPEGEAVLWEAQRHVRVHNWRDRDFGRPRGGSGAVYRYDALAAGQVFEAAILCDNESDASTVAGLLRVSSAAFLGGSRSAGYGRVFIEFVSEGTGWQEEAPQAAVAADESDSGGEDIADEESGGPEGDWDEGDWGVDQDLDEGTPGEGRAMGEAPPANTPAAMGPSEFRITLLSHALVRDENGQYAVSADAVGAAVAHRIGIEPSEVEPTGSFFRSEVMGGFNRTWGLPLHQALAVRLGSMFQLHLKEGGITEDQRRVLAEQGIGERRAEGFGRVAVDWPAQAMWRPAYPDGACVPCISTTVTPNWDADTSDMAARIAGRILNARLEAQVAFHARALAETVRGPSRSQIHRLRLRLQDALASLRQQRLVGGSDVEEIIHHERQALLKYRREIDAREIDARKSAAEQFRRCRVDGSNILDWLDQRVQDSQGGGTNASIWQKLGMSTEHWPRVGSVAVAPTNAMAFEWNLRLVDAVLALAAKRERKGDRRE